MLSPRLALLLALSTSLVACSGDKADTGGDDGATDDGTADGTDGTDGTADGTDGSDGTDGTDGTDGSDGSTGGTGRVRLAHFGVFPGDTGTEVAVFVNGAASGVEFGFKQATPFVELPSGTYQIDIVPVGKGIADSVFTIPAFEIVADADVSAFARGYVAPPMAGDNAFGVGAFVEDRSGIPAGSVRVNVIHAAPLGALDPVDVWLVDGSCAPTGDAPLLDNFAFDAVAANLDLPSTEVNVGFDVGGDATVDACFQIPATIVDEIVNVYAVNDSAGNVSLVAVFPDGATAEITPVVR